LRRRLWARPPPLARPAAPAGGAGAGESWAGLLRGARALGIDKASGAFGGASAGAAAGGNSAAATAAGLRPSAAGAGAGAASAVPAAPALYDGGDADTRPSGLRGGFSKGACQCPCACVCTCTDSPSPADKTPDSAATAAAAAEAEADEDADEDADATADCELYSEALRSGPAVVSALASAAAAQDDWQRLVAAGLCTVVAAVPSPAPPSDATAALREDGPARAARLYREILRELQRARSHTNADAVAAPVDGRYDSRLTVPDADSVLVVAGDPTAPVPTRGSGRAEPSDGAAAARAREHLFVMLVRPEGERAVAALHAAARAAAVVPITPAGRLAVSDAARAAAARKSDARRARAAAVAAAESHLGEVRAALEAAEKEAARVSSRSAASGLARGRRGPRSRRRAAGAGAEADSDAGAALAYVAMVRTELREAQAAVAAAAGTRARFSMSAAIDAVMSARAAAAAAAAMGAQAAPTAVIALTPPAPASVLRPALTQEALASARRRAAALRTDLPQSKASWWSYFTGV
jgi:hypothetical protein